MSSTNSNLRPHHHWSSHVFYKQEPRHHGYHWWRSNAAIWLEPQSTGIPKYAKQTVENIFAVFNTTCVRLQIFHCPVPETKNRGYSIFMYKEDEFVRLKKTVNDDGSPGIAVLEPTMPNIDTITSTITNWKYVTKADTYNQWQAAKKLAIIIFVKFYASSKYLLDL